MKRFYAAVPKGLEYLLVDELNELGAQEVREGLAVVHFQADLTTAYRICLWSRLASRVVMVVTDLEFDDADDLYVKVKAIHWPSLFNSLRGFMVDFHGTNREIRNSQFGALRVKDAVVDCFMEECGQRPGITKRDPEIRIDAVLKGNKLSLGLNFAGAPLHQRGYRTERGQAPLRENLAAAMLIRSGWHKQMTLPLADPFCGSGTLLIEAALMAADKAPGLLREHWGFHAWLGHDEALWQQQHADATLRASRGIKRCQTPLFGRDLDGQVLTLAKQNAKRAGVRELIQFDQGDALEARPLGDEPGFLVTNPPYGERLGNLSGLIGLYSELGQMLKRHWGGWRLSLLCSEEMLFNALRMRADKEYRLFNSNLEVKLCNYTIKGRSEAELALAAPASLGGEEFANRLRKNLKQRKRWLKKQAIDCYRLYDADLPDYNVAVDLYQDWVVVQEYAPPKSVDEARAKARLVDIMGQIPQVLEVDPARIILKTRQRQKGKSQYEKRSTRSVDLVVNEYGAKFKVNLTEYLDTGLFLDHRLARQTIQQMAKGKSFLNLFAYTGTASVHAALGGASATTTVDMSNTYLSWAEENFALNGLRGRQHQFIQADCLQWLERCNQQYDFIFIDPPTFSNSKRMQASFDVQRDHLLLMRSLKRLLRPGGTILFSNNKRNFKMDQAGLAEIGLKAENISARTLSEDFARNKQIHNAWLVTHG
ncbi:bifunctional 23S rRNA (guanine(2069)-N(7))-methyltransferase RlmK/23S rRNA (guanine(2445)-N(2))-methyltransferase RlmL [Ferrimonas sediminicola]|uniref:Ribosomal RNA large subunit methyltransferase K/L n=1 Tax=Ferrimonas sediminicola TaxID=2569538 RepID=A0A4U1BI26_9GAMM|nr:bifunctional 23S rRNA (guanine(2069)-N(7))-methyltransferase RlmK/23S rRNA (guanine(2445)-N(2))-methyltransferase RlmL [Ferrimonas sediminicola]TKB50426.1 bifunctional 23S rRNA (guanine(2069)-N(7))-methyltransferase RlmK/23S rRNA (guanine(2445)-N(2))-methyltransferase RlmL [Ferrimonas sediminicola]